MRPIDADALKTHVCDMCDDGQRECKGDESCAILCWINDMSTIEAEPMRHGRWYEFQCFSEHGIPMASYECTNCGNDIERQRGVLPAYCEFCGAKMDVTNTNVGNKESINNNSFKNGG